MKKNINIQNRTYFGKKLKELTIEECKKAIETYTDMVFKMNQDKANQVQQGSWTNKKQHDYIEKGLTISFNMGLLRQRIRKLEKGAD